MSLRVLLVFCCASAAFAQTSPEQTAYSAAQKLTDPAAKIQALEKVKKDFPKSDLIPSVNRAILTTLVEEFPKQTDRIAKQAKVMYGAAESRNKGSVANEIAVEYLDAGVLLPDAERYARKGVADLKESRYTRELKAGFEKRKQKVPSEEEIGKRYRETRAARLATLGRIEVKRGETASGLKLLEEAWRDNPNLIAAGATLGELSYKGGDDAKALEYLVPARLSGHAPASANQALEALYKKQHGGSLDGFDAMLDAQYRKLYPNPVRVQEYHPTEKRSDRLVLAEVFTGAGCPPCVGADLAFDAAMDRFSRKDLAVVMYHVHVPRPDPMTTADTAALYKAYDVHGVPSYAIDGKMLGGGGGARDYAKTVYERIVAPIEKDLELPAEAKLTVHASLSGNAVTVTGSSDKSEGLKVEVLLLERLIRYTGENGIRFHPMVVRAMSEQKAGESFHHTFDLDEASAALKKHLDAYEAAGHRGTSFKFTQKKYAIDRGNLAVVVMVQDVKTRHILQSALVDLSAGGGAVSTETK